MLFLPMCNSPAVSWIRRCRDLYGGITFDCNKEAPGATAKAGSEPRPQPDQPCPMKVPAEGDGEIAGSCMGC